MSRHLLALSALAGFAGGIGWGVFLAGAGWAQDRARKRRVAARIRRRLDEGKRDDLADGYNELDPAVVELLMRLTEDL
jgi:hypothetical protein